MFEIIKNIIYVFLGIALFIGGCIGGWMKLFKKNSWLYRESHDEEFLYNIKSQQTWGIIVSITMIGLGLIFYSLEKLSLLIKN